MRVEGCELLLQRADVSPVWAPCARGWGLAGTPLAGPLLTAAWGGRGARVPGARRAELGLEHGAQAAFRTSRPESGWAAAPPWTCLLLCKWGAA